jgi:hypothetical protein
MEHKKNELEFWKSNSQFWNPFIYIFLWDSQRQIMGDKKKKGHLDLKGLECNKHKPQKIMEHKKNQWEV